MSLPVAPEYLARALEEECRLKDLTLKHHRIGNLLLPTGRLVACDPFVSPETEPFWMPLQRGTFPVMLSVAEMANDQRVAFATIRFRPNAPVAWDLMTIEGQDTAELKDDEFFGYGVDSGTGCFMDRSAALAVCERMEKEDYSSETLSAEMEKTYRHTWSWLDMNFGDGNLIAFSSGYGDGAYATYMGVGADGEISVVVTDFSVVPVQ